MRTLFHNRQEVIAALVGALVASLLSLLIGIYTLDKSFKLTVYKEQLSGVKKDIEFLFRISNDFDINLQTLAGKNYQVTVKLSEPMDQVEGMARAILSGKNRSKKEEAELRQFLKVLSQSTGGSERRVLEVQKPIDTLHLEAWFARPVEIGDINFELFSDINDYYRRAREVNRYVNYYRSLERGAVVNEDQYDAFVRTNERYAIAISEFLKIDQSKLRGRISAEILRLTKIRENLSDAIDVN